MGFEVGVVIERENKATSAKRDYFRRCVSRFHFQEREQRYPKSEQR